MVAQARVSRQELLDRRTFPGVPSGPLLVEDRVERGSVRRHARFALIHADPSPARRRARYDHQSWNSPWTSGSWRTRSSARVSLLRSAWGVPPTAAAIAAQG